MIETIVLDVETNIQISVPLSLDNLSAESPLILNKKMC